MKPLFHSATIRLTIWYTLILLCISVLFSLVVFEISRHEISRSLGPDRLYTSYPLPIDTDLLQRWRAEHIRSGESRLIGQLIIFNLTVLSTGALGSYLLARRTLEPVEEATEAQARFSSDAAHELRTPLTIMQSEIEVGLRDKQATKTSHAALLRSNLDEVEHMRTLTDRLLMLANHAELAMEPVSLETVAIEAVNRSIPLAQGKHIAIDNEVGGHMVRGNEPSLTDALSILLENAIKYSPAGSTITITASQRSRTAELHVSDEGPGIAAHDLPHIFDRFYRSDQSRSSQNVSGHGLGLSIAKRIVETHGGVIRARNNELSHKAKPAKPRGKTTSKPVAVGATFTIELPLSRE